MAEQDLGAPQLSVIIPVVERRDDLRQLFNEYSAEINRLGRTAEYIFVVDSRQKDAIPVLKELQREVPEQVVLILLGGEFGESASLTVGLKQARGEIIITIASYFQVEPEGLMTALELIEEQGNDLVVGRRFPRSDSFVNRVQSQVFHWLVRLMTGSRFRDISCGFRVMRRSVAQDLNIYGGLHRFIPAIAQRVGFAVDEIKLQQRQEDQTTRYYGLAIYAKRILDIFTLFFLLKFTRRPLRFFGILGLALSLSGITITGYLGIYRLLGLGAIGDRPLLLLGVLLIVLGIQTLSIGLVGEIIIFTHAQKVREYRIREIIQGFDVEIERSKSGEIDGSAVGTAPSTTSTAGVSGGSRT